MSAFNHPFGTFDCIHASDTVSCPQSQQLLDLVQDPFRDCQAVVVVSSKAGKKYPVQTSDSLIQTSNPSSAYRLYLLFTQTNGNTYTFCGTYYREAGQYIQVSELYWRTSPWSNMAFIAQNAINNNQNSSLNNLPNPAVVVACDQKNPRAQSITGIQGVTGPSATTQIHVETLPEPFNGNINAALWMLNENPKYDKDSAILLTPPDSLNILDKFDKVWKLDSCATFVWADTNGLSNLHGGHRYWWFAPTGLAPQNYQPKFKYKFKLKYLDQLVQSKPKHKQIKDCIMDVEFFPYATQKGFPDCYAKPNALPSYAFTDQLIWYAMYYGRNILVLRKLQEWIKRVPVLETYDNFYVIRNPQGCNINKINVCRCIDFNTWQSII